MELAAERTKTVLILMSDTGGGHRTSAEAIKAAFRTEFGDEYKVYVTRAHTLAIQPDNVPADPLPNPE